MKTKKVNTKLLITMRDGLIIEIGCRESFIEKVKDIFKSKIYISIVDSGYNLAINTDNIQTIKEEQK